MIIIFKCILLVINFSFLFSYENKFSCDVNSNDDKINLTHAPELVEVSGGYVRLAKMGEGHLTELGKPELPTYTTYYQLDPSKTYAFELEVLESEVIENIIILPHQGMEKWEVDAVSLIDESLYSSHEVFPSQNMVISDRRQGRGIEFLSIQVIPYKYYPKYERLEVFTSIDIHVIETGENPNNELNQPKRSHVFDAFYEDLIVNFTSSDRSEDYQASSILYIAGGDWLNNSYVQDLLHWRHKQGYIVNVVSTSEIGASNGNESIIKDYISDAYFNWENPPEIVGLIGDTNVIDCFYQDWGTGGWNYYNGSTDSDFSQLDGDDLIPEVFVGRISGQGQSVMENVVNKTIQYE